FVADERCSHRQNMLSPILWDADRDEVMRTNGRGLAIAVLLIVLLGAHAPSALAAQAKPLIKVVVGYVLPTAGSRYWGLLRKLNYLRSAASMWCSSAWALDRCHCGR